MTPEKPDAPSPGPLPGTGNGRGQRAEREDDRKAPERTCVATRTVRSPDELVRFVRAPDGTVVADLKRELPGRGVWVTATADAVRLAMKKKAIARGFKEPATVDPELALRVDEAIERSALGMLGFAQKAGRVVCGFSKVEAALSGEPVAALIEAEEAGADGVRKLGQAMSRHGKHGAIRVVKLFSSGQLDLALGRSNVVHAALLAGPVSAAFLARCDALARYRGVSDGPIPAQGAGMTSADAGEPAGNG